MLFWACCMTVAVAVCLRVVGAAQQAGLLAAAGPSGWLQLYQASSRMQQLFLT
jgi:hypothetical protein